MRIFLCGVKHCGKTTLGRILARLTGAQFRDTDQVLEELYAAQTGQSASSREIFRTRGEEFFRRLEAEAVEKTSMLPAPLVVGLGGGALDNAFIDPVMLKKTGKIVFLDIDQHTAFRRIALGGLPPFLADAPDPEAEFRRRNAGRIARFTRFADFRFELGEETPPAEAAEQLRSALGKAWEL